jgi:hypothetical protein
VSSNSDVEVRARLANNARAAKMDRLRNEARSRWPGLDDDQIEDKARDLEREELRAYGLKGSETTRRRSAEQRALLEQRDLLIDQAEQFIALLRSSSEVAA